MPKSAKDNRISVRPYLLPYVETIGEELGTSDITEVVNQILIDHKRGICRCKGHPIESSHPFPDPPSPSTEDLLLEEFEELLPPKR